MISIRKFRELAIEVNSMTHLLPQQKVSLLQYLIDRQIEIEREILSIRKIIYS